jgi:hypothetical protein
MQITFLSQKAFGDLEKESHQQASFFEAGFGLGKNVSQILKVDGKVYCKLSPIASDAYNGTSQEIKNERIIKQINRLVSQEA